MYIHKSDNCIEISISTTSLMMNCTLDSVPVWKLGYQIIIYII